MQIIHESIYAEVVKRLVLAYASVKVGNPLIEGILCGPLHSKAALTAFTNVKFLLFLLWGFSSSLLALLMLNSSISLLTLYHVIYLNFMFIVLGIR